MAKINYKIVHKGMRMLRSTPIRFALLYNGIGVGGATRPAPPRPAPPRPNRPDCTLEYLTSLDEIN